MKKVFHLSRFIDCMTLWIINMKNFHFHIICLLYGNAYLIRFQLDIYLLLLLFQCLGSKSIFYIVMSINVIRICGESTCYVFISCVLWTKWIHIWQKARPTIKYRHQLSFCTHCRFQNNRFIDTIIENGLFAFKHCSLSSYKKKMKSFNRKLQLHIGSNTYLHIEFVSILL